MFKAPIQKILCSNCSHFSICRLINEFECLRKDRELIMEKPIYKENPELQMDIRCSMFLTKSLTRNVDEPIAVTSSLSNERSPFNV